MPTVVERQTRPQAVVDRLVCTPKVSSCQGHWGSPFLSTASIDEVRVSDTARSACWVGASYNNEAWPDKALTPTPDPTPNPSEGFYGVDAPTAVELVSFTARGLDGAVELQWETGSEMDNLGFHLYRSLSAAGPWERITASLIPGLGSSPMGARYRYVDMHVTNGVTYFYELEDIETTGRTSVTARSRPPRSREELPAGMKHRRDESSSSVITYGNPEANHLRVLKRGRYQVVVELTTEGFLAYPEPDGSVRIELADDLEVDDSGLPIKRTWVEALAGRHVELVSIREQDIETFGLRPAGSSTSSSPPRRVWCGLRRRPRARVRRTVSKQGDSSESARVASIAFQGEVKKALVEMEPFRWDASRPAAPSGEKALRHFVFRQARSGTRSWVPTGGAGVFPPEGQTRTRGGVVARSGYPERRGSMR